ncbi:MAG: outer membrane lipoprotein-sorting protein [Leptospiraceae bacterium]|nr:outer membrane lipoprotein-sorting protein [Leptospiraceae bacterium]MCP5493867.1 outer membrane lipoprotein-sorting protein [Leptospiraceae bacterium]
MKYGKFFLCILVFFSIHWSATQGKEANSVQGVVTLYDGFKYIEDGYIKAKLKFKQKNGKKKEWDVQIFKSEGEALYVFEEHKHSPVLKILYKNKNRDIYYQNTKNFRVYQMLGDEKYENVLHTSFTYKDLSFYLFEVNYVSLILTKESYKGQNMVRLPFKPLDPNGYKKLVLYLNAKNFEPERLDFYGVKMEFLKSLKYKFATIKKIENKQASTTRFPAIMETVDAKTYNVSTFQILELNKDIIPNKAFFSLQNLK